MGGAPWPSRARTVRWGGATTVRIHGVGSAGFPSRQLRGGRSLAQRGRGRLGARRGGKAGAGLFFLDRRFRRDGRRRDRGLRRQLRPWPAGRRCRGRRRRRRGGLAIRFRARLPARPGSSGRLLLRFRARIDDAGGDRRGRRGSRRTWRGRRSSAGAEIRTTSRAATNTPAHRTSIPNMTPKGRREGDCARIFRRMRAERSAAAGAGSAERKAARLRANASAASRHAAHPARCDSKALASAAGTSPSCRRERNSEDVAGWSVSFIGTFRRAAE